jgi:hypothetical protein
MFKIKNSQIEVFDRITYNNFVNKMVNYVHEVFEVKISSIELNNFIINCIADAQSYNIIFELDIQGYIELCYCCDELSQNPKPFWIESILLQNKLKGFQKIHLLYSRLIENVNKKDDVFLINEISEPII